MTVPDAQVRLRRSIGARVSGGWVLQPVLSMVTVVLVLVVGAVAYFVGSVPVIPSVFYLPVVLVWLIGMTAGARADAGGVSWRYFARRRSAWGEISSVELGRQGRSRFGGPGAPVVAVVVGGRRCVITPALDVGDRRLKDFVDGLTALAAAAGVAVELDPRDDYWRELLAGDLTG